jgi:hypothetical protein
MRAKSKLGFKTRRSMVKVLSPYRIPAAPLTPGVDSFRPVSGLAKMPLHLPARNVHAVVFEAGFAARM